MNDRAFDGISRWLPLVISLAANAVMFGVFYGNTTEQLRSLRESDLNLRNEIMPMSQRLQVFIPRSEFTPIIDSLHRDVTDLKVLAKESQVTIKDSNDKVLALYQLQLSAIRSSTMPREN